MREFYLIPRAMAEKYCTSTGTRTGTPPPPPPTRPAAGVSTSTKASAVLPVELQVRRPRKRIVKAKDIKSLRGLIDVMISRDLQPGARALLDYLAPNPLLQWNEKGDLGGVLEGQNIVQVIQSVLSADTKLRKREDRDKLRYFHQLVPIPREYVNNTSARTLLYGGGSYKRPSTNIWKPY